MMPNTIINNNNNNKYIYWKINVLHEKVNELKGENTPKQELKTTT